MGISLKQAFVFVPQDRHWVSKVLIGGLLLFFPCFIYVFPGIRRLLFNPINYYALTVFSILIFIGVLAICGYFFKVIHNRIVHENGRLPSWKFFNYYIYIGFKAFVGGLLLSLPFVLTNALICYFAPLSFSKEVLPFIICIALVHFVYTLFYVMLALNFSLDFKIASFLNIKKAFTLIKHNILNYLILVCECIFVFICYFILSMILFHGQILALLLPFFSFYMCLVFSDLFAQFEVNLKDSDFYTKRCFV